MLTDEDAVHPGHLGDAVARVQRAAAQQRLARGARVQARVVAEVLRVELAQQELALADQTLDLLQVRLLVQLLLHGELRLHAHPLPAALARRLAASLACAGGEAAVLLFFL